MVEQLTTNEVRQGRNIRGMIWVLVIGIALVVAAYMIMLAVVAQPVTPDGRALEPSGIAGDAAAPNASPPMETQ